RSPRRCAPPRPPAPLCGGGAALVGGPAAEGTMIDLTRSPTRYSAGFAVGASSRIWMNPGHQPVEVAVKLPSGRVYHAGAAMAAMLSPTSTGDPDRLTVQLPAADLDATGRLLAQYAVAWGFPSDEVATWRASAAPRASAGPEDDAGSFSYSTRVFTGTDDGLVHVEFQVSQHLREREFVVTALFTWGTPLPGAGVPLSPRRGAPIETSGAVTVSGGVGLLRAAQPGPVGEPAQRPGRERPPGGVDQRLHRANPGLAQPAEQRDGGAVWVR